ncbi:MAG: PQQ-dependent sugar dehydrogenase, partial [Candidatus Paceibacterota bacterium]
GDETAEGMIAPAEHSGPDITWAPASATYWDGSIFFGGLRGAAVYEAVLDGEEVTEIRQHFFEEFGRIRTTRLGPDGYFYFTTSNRDGRGESSTDDDRIIRVDPEQVFRN